MTHEFVKYLVTFAEDFGGYRKNNKISLHLWLAEGYPLACVTSRGLSLAASPVPAPERSSGTQTMLFRSGCRKGDRECGHKSW